jgi:homoserine dehydrogenase
VARKALIVARTAGLDIEGEAIQLDPLLPGLERGLEAALGEHGGRLLERAQEAKQCGEVLRYVAEVSPRRVRVGPTTVPVASPIGALRGCDNILVYQTERYHALPLVIRGPGAGAEVTAAGVLGDVLKIARR